jgi:hypothetical protein
MLVCDDETDQDWAAWITTFGAKIRPFSAYMRLFTYTGILRVVKAARTPTLDRFSWPLAGIVLGEVLASSGLPDKALEALPAAACASTLSFAMFRARACYFEFDAWEYIVAAWDGVREATRQRARVVDSSAIARVCGLVIDATSRGDRVRSLPYGNLEILEACEELLSLREDVPSIVIKVPLVAAVERRMHGSREDRVVAFEEFMVRVADRLPTDPEVTAFLLGYLASRIAPGTIRHSSVLMPIAQRYPTALLWYGFCAGLGSGRVEFVMPKEDQGAGRAGLDLPSSARRVVRDLLQPEVLTGPPSRDISFLELRALSRTGGDPLEGIISTTQGTVTVELIPGVWTAVNVSSRAAMSENVRSARERETMARLGETIERLNSLYRELPIGGIDAEQESLFPTKRRK